MFVARRSATRASKWSACLALRIRPEKEFSRIVGLGQFGETGETYAFDKNGLMVSNSRFDDELILLGLLARPGGLAVDPATLGPRSGRRHDAGPPSRACGGTSCR